MTHEQTLFAYVGAFAEELVRSGVEHAVICPGSRSTPLAVMLSRQAGLKVWMHVDERSAGFFALGMAKARGTPVALVCTSGTAAANFLPAVVEAHYGRVPLIVCTADRPPELRDVGAPQTIDQVRLYGVHAKWFVDMLLPEATPEALRYVRTVAGRAVATAKAGPAGPVHLNFPFREPLMPEAGGAVPVAARRDNNPYVDFAEAPDQPRGASLRWLQLACERAERGIIVCGPVTDDLLVGDDVAALATRLQWPVLADPLSELRTALQDRTLVIDAYDAFLRDERWTAEHGPDAVIRFGAMPTSKALTLFLQRNPDAQQFVVDQVGWLDPTLLASGMIAAEADEVCAGLLRVLRERPPSPTQARYTRAWVEANRRTRAAITGRLDGMTELFEGKLFAELGALLPERATIFVGNSMPIRDLDAFFPATDRVLFIMANRGANGIDGVVSTALGVAAAHSGPRKWNEPEYPVVLVLGDLSFYHDMNGLLAAKLYGLKATIILLNNDGGGIFSFLPQAGATTPEQFERLFGTPTGLDFRPAVEMYGGRFERPADWPAFRAAVQAGLAGDGLTVIEVRTDRTANVAQHRAFWPLVSAALAADGEAAE